jgi:hypothetical protein
VQTVATARLPPAVDPRSILERVAPGLALAVFCGLAGAGCCVAPPSAGDLFAIGFRTPEQAFASFQTAVRADDLSLMRRCLSADFIARERLSELAWRVFWEKAQKEQPLLRKGLADARPGALPEVRGARARMRVASHGRQVLIDLVREDFCEAWSGAEKVADEAAPFGERTGVQAGDAGSRWFFGRLPLPAGADPGRITELRVGREWKIDGFRLVEPGAKADKVTAERDALP